MMENSILINKSKHAIAYYLVTRLSEEMKISKQEALIILLHTDTYTLLQDNDSGFYAESAAFVYSELMDEMALEKAI